MLATLPARAVMLAAFLDADPDCDGLFLAGVRTTGIVCRPSCGARKPLPGNVEFFRTMEEALAAGYRACRRCHPARQPGEPPPWVAGLLADAEREPGRRWREADLRQRGLNADRVRRWFRAEYGMTFSAWQRARRLGGALARLRDGQALLPAAFDSGFESPSGFNGAIGRLVGTSPARARGALTVRLRRIATPLGPMLAGATDRAAGDGAPADGGPADGAPADRAPADGARGEGICLLEFTDRRQLEQQLRTLAGRLGATFVPAAGGDALLDRLEAELERYFAGSLREFSVPLALAGTPFQRTVWERLRRIPCGATMSYAALARAVGRPGAMRAVARANGDNRLAILVPCHRVIGSDGQLTGYGGGLLRKQWLLDLERGGAGASRTTGLPR